MSEMEDGGIEKTSSNMSGASSARMRRDVSEGAKRGGVLFFNRWWTKEAFEPFLQKQLLFVWTFGCVMVGIGLGCGLRYLDLSQITVDYIAFPGELMVRSLQVIFLPIVALSLLAGIVGLRHVNDKLSSAIVRYLAFLWLLMVLAVGISIVVLHFLALGNTISPLSTSIQGSCDVATIVTVNATGDAQSIPWEAADEPLLYFGRLVVPTNLFEAAAEAQYLGVISFITIFGLLTVTFGEAAEQLMVLMEVLNGIITQMLYRIVWFIPIGTASLVAGTLLRACNILLFFWAAALFSASVIVVLLVYGLVVAPVMFFFLSNVNVVFRMRCFFPAFLTAWGTASSTATFSSSVECAVDGGCHVDLAHAVLRLASSLNRAGSTLYEATAVLFIAQIHGMRFSASGLLLISLLTTFSPVASMPMGALLSSITALQVYGMDNYLAELAMILSVDWLLDRFRTVVNIWGDWCTTICIDEWNKARNGGNVLVEENQEGV